MKSKHKKETNSIKIIIFTNYTKLLLMHNKIYIQDILNEKLITYIFPTGFLKNWLVGDVLV